MDRYRVTLEFDGSDDDFARNVAERVAEATGLGVVELRKATPYWSLVDLPDTAPVEAR